MSKNLNADVVMMKSAEYRVWTDDSSPQVAGHGREAWRAAPRYRAVAVRHFVHANNPRAVLLRQYSICDNQSHHARENQQCREGEAKNDPPNKKRERVQGEDA